MKPSGVQPDPVPPVRPRRNVGIDAEQVSRFEKFSAGQKPWRHVYSPREAAHLVVQPRAARAFCFAFCFKEALCKALGEAYAFPGCECLYREGEADQEVLIAPELLERHALARVAARFDGRFLEERGECLVEVRVSRGALAPGVAGARMLPDGAVAERRRAHLETIAVAEVAGDRPRIERAHFSPGELTELGRRPVQSLAGFLALKRALARLATGATPAPRPRDFELGHHPSGAPRLVAAPAGFPAADALVSITHTRAWAYALAELRDGEDDLLYCGEPSAREGT